MIITREKMKQAVLFDMNGVIVDDESLHERAFGKVLAERGFDLTHEEYQRCFAGRTDRDGLISYQKAHAIVFDLDSVMKEKTIAYQKLSEDGLQSYLGVIPLIKAIKAEGIQLGLVTSATYFEVEAVLLVFSLKHDFSVIVTAEDIHEGKPSPEGYLLGASRLGVKPENCVVVEDAPSGIKAAKAVGMHCIAVAHTHRANDLSEADIVIEAFNERTLGLITRFFDA